MTSIAIPDDRSYTDDHEWVMLAKNAAVPDSPVRVGISAVAIDSLGELVFVELPEVGSTVTVGETCGEVESTKTVSELFPPVSGRVTLVNAAAVENPEIITADPYGEGWLFAVQATEAGSLLTAAEYSTLNGLDG